MGVDTDSEMAEVARHYDHFDPRLAADPYPLFERFRTECPVAHSDQHGGFYALSRYDDLATVARDWATFSSAIDGASLPSLPFPRLPPIEVDPPLHTEYRRIMGELFSPRAVLTREPQIRAQARHLLTLLKGSPEFEFSSRFAVPFPQQVTLRLLGFPDEDRADLARWIEQITRCVGTDIATIAEPGANVVARVVERISERRRDPSLQGEDLLSKLINGNLDGRPLTDEEIVLVVFMVLFGALDTTTSAINGSAWYLAEHPEARQRCRGEVDMSLAADEFIRWTSPIQGTGRTVAKDTTVHGCPMHHGDRILMLWASGNRDPLEFPNPDEVVLDRSPNRHMAFGLGPHRCIGSHIARLMVRVALEELLTAGDFVLAPDAQVQWVTGATRGIRALQLAWT